MSEHKEELKDPVLEADQIAQDGDPAQATQIYLSILNGSHADQDSLLRVTFRLVKMGEVGLAKPHIGRMVGLAGKSRDSWRQLHRTLRAHFSLGSCHKRRGSQEEAAPHLLFVRECRRQRALA